MEIKILDHFWKNKKILITGHTGFKGTWLSLFLSLHGAKLFGYSLKPDSNCSFYNSIKKKNKIFNITGDIRNLSFLNKQIKKIKPDIVFHLAAQPIVRDSYQNSLLTYQTNVQGTINLFECLKNIKKCKAIINITTDKCYLNLEKKNNFKENDALGGKDPYSASKACSEIVTHSYYESFFKDKSIGLSSARAGNIIGGGDWSKDRIVPDIMRSFYENKKLKIRYPKATRPWQYILDALNGYTILAKHLYLDPNKYSGAWNFGPNLRLSKSVNFLLNKFKKKLGNEFQFVLSKNTAIKEANFLMLDSKKANNNLNWYPKIDLDLAILNITKWYHSYYHNEDIYDLSINEIRNFLKLNY